MEYRVVYLAVVKAYSQDDPEIIVLSRPTKAGAQVTFQRGLGEEFFGEVFPASLLGRIVRCINGLLPLRETMCASIRRS